MYDWAQTFCRAHLLQLIIHRQYSLHHSLTSDWWWGILPHIATRDGTETVFCCLPQVAGRGSVELAILFHIPRRNPATFRENGDRSLTTMKCLTLIRWLVPWLFILQWSEPTLADWRERVLLKAHIKEKPYQHWETNLQPFDCYSVLLPTELPLAPDLQLLTTDYLLIPIPWMYLHHFIQTSLAIVHIIHPIIWIIFLKWTGIFVSTQ